MNYVVLARKYRPQTWDEVAGQGHVAKALRSAMQQGKVGHAYLFVGPRGVGKTSMARIFAKALNCPHAQEATPCNSCDVCKGITAGSDLDVIEFDAASNRQVDDIQNLILDTVHLRPARNRFKVYIVDEVHMISTTAFNAFLKTLEEPPAHVKFVFATTEPDKIPETVASRCQRFDFKAIGSADIMRLLRDIARKEQIDVDDGALSFITRMARGGLRDAQGLLDQVMVYGGRSVSLETCHDVFGTLDQSSLLQLLGRLLGGEAAAAFEAVNRVEQGGKDVSRFAEQCVDALRDLLVAAHCGVESDLLHMDASHRKTLAEIKSTVQPAQLEMALQLMTEAQYRMRHSNVPAILLEMALLRMAELRDTLAISDILKKLEALEARMGGATAPAAPRAPVASPAVASRPRPDETTRVMPQAVGVVPVPAQQEAQAAVAAVPAQSDDELTRAMAAKWPDIMETLKRKNRRLAGYVNSMSVGQATENRLVLQIPQGFGEHVKKMEDAENRAAVADAALEVTGKKYVVAYAVGGEVRHPVVEEEGTAKHETQRIVLDELRKDPVIKKAIDLFDGRIIDIKR